MTRVCCVLEKVNDLYLRSLKLEVKGHLCGSVG